jgi:hypothetical protein
VKVVEPAALFVISTIIGAVDGIDNFGAMLDSGTRTGTQACVVKAVEPAAPLVMSMTIEAVDEGIEDFGATLDVCRAFECVVVPVVMSATIVVVVFAGGRETDDDVSASFVISMTTGFIAVDNDGRASPDELSALTDSVEGFPPPSSAVRSITTILAFGAGKACCAHPDETSPLTSAAEDAALAETETFGRVGTIVNVASMVDTNAVAFSTDTKSFFRRQRTPKSLEP